jgi:hypothetical protein
MTKDGVTNKKICEVLQTTTPMAKSSLFFIAALTVVAYSTAMPRIGTKIRLLKAQLTWDALTIPSIPSIR